MKIVDIAASPAFVFAGEPHQARKRAVLRAELAEDGAVAWWVVAWRYDYDDGAGNHTGCRYDDPKQYRPEFLQTAHAAWLFRCEGLHNQLGAELVGIDIGWSALEEVVDDAETV